MAGEDDIDKLLGDIASLEAEVAGLKAYKTALVESRPHHEKLLDDLVTAEAKVSALTDEVAELKLKLDQARGDIRHIREYEVKPRDEAFRELRLNDDIGDCVELVYKHLDEVYRLEAEVAELKGARANQVETVALEVIDNEVQRLEDVATRESTKGNQVGAKLYARLSLSANRIGKMVHQAIHQIGQDDTSGGG